MIRGRTITVLKPAVSGEDALGAPIADYVPETIDDVLVDSPSADDVSDTTRNGIEIDMVLRFPKSYEPETMKGCRIVIGGEYAGEYECIGEMMRMQKENCPTRWNKHIGIRRVVG